MERKSKISNNNPNQINIEDQITSMLENVLKDDSDDSNEYKDINQKYIQVNPNSLKINKQTNNQVNFNNQFNNSPQFQSYNRKEKKFNSNNFQDSRSFIREIMVNPNDFQQSSRIVQPQPQLFINNVPLVPNEMEQRENQKRCNLNSSYQNNLNINNNYNNLNNMNNHRIDFIKNNSDNNLYMNNLNSNAHNYKPKTVSPRLNINSEGFYNLNSPKLNSNKLSVNQNMGGNSNNQNFQNVFSQNQQVNINSNFFVNEKNLSNSKQYIMLQPQNNFSSINLSNRLV